MKELFFRYCRFLDSLLNLWLELNRWIMRVWLVAVHIILIYVLIDSII